MTIAKNLPILLSIVDHTIASIFLLDSLLKEGVNTTVNPRSLDKQIDQLIEYWNKIAPSLVNNEKADLDFLKKEVNWSISLCDTYLGLLLPTNAGVDNLQILNPRTVFNGITRYKELLNDIAISINAYKRVLKDNLRKSEEYGTEYR